MNTLNIFQKIARGVIYPLRALYYNLFFIINIPRLTTQKVASHIWNGYELTANGILIRVQES